MKYAFPLLTTFAVAATLGLSGCATDGSTTQRPMLGADRDAHGCLGSAGYDWCEHTQRCERPWELAKQKGFPVSAENFSKYCQTGSTSQ
nr:hypothetical protein [Burkholderia ubonensis]